MTSYSEKLKDPRWKKRRLEILRRDCHECQGCNARASEGPLHVHHRWYQGEPWEAPDDALTTLCERCHEEETWWEKHGRPRLKARRRAGGPGRGYCPIGEILEEVMQSLVPMRPLRWDARTTRFVESTMEPQPSTSGYEP